MEGIILIAVVAVVAYFAYKNRKKLKGWFADAKDLVEDKIDDLKD